MHCDNGILVVIVFRSFRRFSPLPYFIIEIKIKLKHEQTKASQSQLSFKLNIRIGHQSGVRK